ncbi:hypothetical protein [Hymenobacter cellulosivorans]|uniref:DUF4840 domain-containing protein n=1 Tax=Hymenobacter cellulosivorans TaxID=2932249 RepID=A0ABY4FAA7_9BACT|nr:hypothetical protein [Hymenobacter cellulosivorans]UOQ52859.1 hypothetical protein MUN80_24345 [Hymenobacter cellulosivorans]
MKKIIFGLLLLVAFGGTLSSCKEDSAIPAPAVESVPLVLPQITTGKDFFNILAARAATNTNPTRPIFEFTLAPNQQRDLKLQTIEVYKSFRRGDLLGPRVKVGDYSSFPATVSLTSTEALKDLQRYTGTSLVSVIPPGGPDVTNILLSPNDAIVFTFEYIVEGGRRIVLTPVNSMNIPSGTQILAPYAAVAVFRNP